MNSPYVIASAERGALDNRLRAQGIVVGPFVGDTRSWLDVVVERVYEQCDLVAVAALQADPPEPKRRFDINPGPLKVVPASQRRPFAKPEDLANVGRCDAIVKDGSGNRCLRDGVEDFNGRWLCAQHAKAAWREAERKIRGGRA